MGTAINSVFRVYEASTTTMRTALTTRVSRADEKKDMVALSSKAKDFQSVKRALQNTPDVRADKVEYYKSRIEADLFDVNAQLLAEKIMSKMNTL